MKHFVYCTHNDKTGEFYIGKHSAKDENDRYFGSSSIVKQWLREKDPVRRVILLECSSELLAYAVEEKLVSSARNQYGRVCRNLFAGGRGQYTGVLCGENSPRFGVKTPKEVREKQRAAKVGRQLTDEHKRKIGEGVRKIVTPEWRKKVSDAQRGKKKPASFLKKMGGARNPMAKSIKCVETGHVFKCCKDAAEWLGVGRSCISNHLNDRANYKKAGGKTFEVVKTRASMS